MLRFFIRIRIRSYERRLGVKLDYLRHILRVSLRAFFKFSKIFSLAAYRRSLPSAPCHIARLVTMLDEDCGDCVQIAVNMAKKDGVPVDVIQAVMDGRADALPESLADVYRFTEAVVRGDGDEEPYRERIRNVFGEEGLVELAMTIASAKVFPITKRALGYATNCSRVALS
jgi:alkylhydroperoxidase family enzyme